MRTHLLVAAGLLGLASLALAGEDAAGPAPAFPKADVPAREDALEELGRRLFFDPAASRVGMRSCADCHDPAHGYSDRERHSLDDVGPTRRHAQTIVDAASLRAAHWDGEFERVEDLVRSRLSVEISRDGRAHYPTQSAREESDARKKGDPGLLAAEARAVASPAGAPASERGAVRVPAAASAAPEGEPARAFVDASALPSIPGAAQRIARDGRYAEALEAAFGSKEPTLDRLACALQRYCAGVASGESAYDRFAAGQRDAMTDAAQRGLALFRGAAGCASCHTMDGARASFTDGDFHDTGVSWRAHAVDDRLGDGDLGAGRHTHRIRHFRAFKTPTLRDVASRGPYMHDGSLATLEDVVRAYAAGPVDDPRIDPAFPRFEAKGTDVADLVAFLRALTSDRRPGLARTLWSRRAKETRLVLVDAAGAPLVGAPLVVVPAGDALPGFVDADGAGLRLVTDAEGAVRFAPPRSTHARVVLEGPLAGVPQALVPDTCGEARVVVPVRGTATVRVRFEKGVVAPDTLTASLVEASVFPGRRRPALVFARRPAAGDAATSEGETEVVYEAPFRTDAGPTADLAVPGATRAPRVRLDPATPAVVTIP